MKQPDLESRKTLREIEENSVSIVRIPGTKRSVKVRWMHAYTMERLTDLWIERDMAAAKIAEASDVAKDLCKEPYFAFKEASLIVLNNDLKIRLLHPFYWRWLAHKYSEQQMRPIIKEGKKKLPLMSHYLIMASSMDMRTDFVRMTSREAEEYQRELLSARKQLSSKTSPDTGVQDGDSADGSGTSAIGASSL